MWKVGAVKYRSDQNLPSIFGWLNLIKPLDIILFTSPTTISALLALVDKVESDELSVDDLVDGLIDSDVGAVDAVELASAEDDTEDDVDDDEEEDEDGAKAAAISAEALAKLKEEVVKRFAVVRAANQKMTAILPVRGSQDAEYQALLAEI